MWLRRTLAQLITALFWIWTGSKIALDLYGRGLAAEDLTHSRGLMDRALGWLFTTPWYVPGALAVIITMFLVYSLRERQPILDRLGNSGPPVPRWHWSRFLSRLRAPSNTSTRRIYVGEIHADFSRFESDFYVELAIRGYNAADCIIGIGQVRGAIRYGESIDGQGTERDLLPAPVLLADRTNTSNIAPFSEIFLVLEQRIPRSIALRMKELFDSGQSVTFDLRSLDISVVVANSDDAMKLPLSGLSFKRANRIVVNRIVYAHGNATVTAEARLG